MTGVTRQTRDTVLRRDGGACVACGRVIAVDDGDHMRPIDSYSLQHRLARGMGGRSVDNDPTNLVTVCGSATTGCHQRIESHPEWARSRGYRVDTWDSPEMVPVVVTVAPGVDAVFGLRDDHRFQVYPEPGGTR